MRKTTAVKYQGPDSEEPTLYVVANRAEAAFYLAKGGLDFHFVDRLTHKKGRLTEGELDADKPGRTASHSAPGSAGHSLDRHFHQTEHESEKFAHKIGEQIGKARREGKFRDVVLVAEPRFLGLLRASLDHETRTAVTQEIAHEYTHISEAELHERIRSAQK